MTDTDPDVIVPAPIAIVFDSHTITVAVDGHQQLNPHRILVMNDGTARLLNQHMVAVRGLTDVELDAASPGAPFTVIGVNGVTGDTETWQGTMQAARRSGCSSCGGRR